MARPKKEGHSINFYLDAGLYEYLSAMTKISGKTKTDIIETALSQYLGVYADSSGSIKAIPAYLLRGASDYEQKVAENEGREPVITKVRCYVLEQTTIFNQPYYKVYEVESQQIMKVPVAHVEFDN